MLADILKDVSRLSNQLEDLIKQYETAKSSYKDTDDKTSENIENADENFKIKLRSEFYELDSKEDETMEKEILRAKALKQDYGEACTVLVVRKCMKALRSTLHDVCKSVDRKCTWQFMLDFKQYAVSACYHQFLNQTIVINNNVNNTKMYHNIYRNDDRDIYSEETGAGLSELRQGYFDSACLRTLPEDVQPEAVVNTIVDKNTKEVNILRSKFEKACKKSSYRKCFAAGKYASSTTCAIHKCIKTKKKVLKKSYKKRCAQIYGYKSSDSSESDEKDSREKMKRPKKKRKS